MNRPATYIAAQRPPATHRNPAIINPPIIAVLTSRPGPCTYPAMLEWPADCKASSRKPHICHVRLATLRLAEAMLGKPHLRTRGVRRSSILPPTRPAPRHPAFERQMA